jgi:hypothetical protein
MKIIYPNGNSGVALAAVNPKYTDLVAAGKKFVPKGLPFKVVNESDLPDDDTFFDAWEYNFSNNDGVGERE